MILTKCCIKECKYPAVKGFRISILCYPLCMKHKDKTYLQIDRSRVLKYDYSELN